MFTKKRKNAILSKYGKMPTEHYEDEDLYNIRSYFDHRHEKERNVFSLDETTWYDLSMDTLFERICNTNSASGEQLLYYQLRCPAVTREEYQKRYALIRIMEEEQELRQKIQLILARLGKSNAARTIEAFSPSNHKKNMLIIALLLLLGFVVSGVCLLISRTALPFFIAFLCGNPIYHIAMIRRLENNLPAANYSVSMTAAYHKIQRLENDKLTAYLRPYNKAGKNVRVLSRIGIVSFASNNEVMQVLNSLFLFDLILYELLKVELSRLRDDVFAIHECIGGLDAAIAVASYRKSSGIYCEPNLCFNKEEPSRICAVDLVHPLLKNPIPNTVELNAPMLLTGSNASGKSTLIKSVALSAIMAQSICTAPCTAYTATTFHIYTSMALTDDLLAGESYFITELKAFKRILSAIEKGERVLCAVDEILRGTNTVERIAASSTLLKYIAGSSAICIAATHDLELCTLLSEHYKMAHFEETLMNDTIVFDYLLHTGPACTRNAIRLLALMGFDKAITSEAEKRAEKYLSEGCWQD